MALPVTIDDIEAAQQRLEGSFERGVIERTPTVSASWLAERTGFPVELKLENLQRTGAFKVRGAFNRIAALPDQHRQRGVIAASAGNHAQGVALAAREQGVAAVIVMPETAPISKVEATRALGAEVVLAGQDYNQAYERARAMADQRGLTFVHAYDDPHIIAGQGTLGLELLDQVADLDTVVVSVGGGGLIAGVATAIKARSPDTRVVGVEPTGAASMAASRRAGSSVRLDRVDTIADGLATRESGSLALEICAALVDDVLTVEDDWIANAILSLLERQKTVAEGAGAASVAALLEGLVEPQHPSGTVAAVVSGGNIDVTLLEHVIDRGLVRSGRYVKVDVPLPDHPGSLHRLLGTVADARANVHRVSHDRRVAEAGVRTVLVRIEAETRGPAHAEELFEALAKAGYEARRAR